MKFISSAVTIRENENAFTMMGEVNIAANISAPALIEANVSVCKSQIIRKLQSLKTASWHTTPVIHKAKDTSADTTSAVRSH